MHREHCAGDRVYRPRHTMCVIAVSLKTRFLNQNNHFLIKNYVTDVTQFVAIELLTAKWGFIEMRLGFGELWQSNGNEHHQQAAHVVVFL